MTKKKVRQLVAYMLSLCMLSVALPAPLSYAQGVEGVLGLTDVELEENANQDEITNEDKVENKDEVLTEDDIIEKVDTEELISMLEIEENAPYFEENTLYGNNNALVVTEIEGSITAFWDKNMDKAYDNEDIKISLSQTTSNNCNDWDIYGGKKVSNLDVGSQITILAGSFKSINGGSKEGNRFAYIGVLNPLASGELENFDQVSYQVTIDSTNDTEPYTLWQPYRIEMVSLEKDGIPIKEGSRFLGYYDEQDGGKQYYNDQGEVSNTGENSAVIYDKENISTLYAQWASEKGIFAGRFSSYQVFDCWRDPATPEADKNLRVYKFNLPFKDLDGDEVRMKVDDVKGKIFSIRPSGDKYRPFIVYMADTTGGENARPISRNGIITALGDEGLLFISQGSDKGYFFSLAQGFDYGKELTFMPKYTGTVDLETAEKAPASPSPWEPDASCAVIFDSQGAETIALPSQISVKKTTTSGVVLGSLPSEPIKAGFTFKGWFTEKDGKGTEITKETILSQTSVTAYAYWKIADKKVSISLANEDKSIEKNLGETEINSSWAGTIKIDEGYKIIGIASVKAGESIIDSSKYNYNSNTGSMTIDKSAVTGDIIIAIKTEPISYKIEYDLNGATGIAPLIQTVTYGKKEFKFAEQGNMKYLGHSFIGWAENSSSDKADYKSGDTITKDFTTEDQKIIKLYAIWQEKTYTISYKQDGYDDISKKWSEKDLIPSLEPKKDGYTFEGWYYGDTKIENTNTVSSLIPLEDDNKLVIKPKWKKVDGLDANIAGTVEDENGKIVQGATVRLTQGNKTKFKTTTDKDGKYSLVSIKPGIYNLVAESKNQTVTVIIIVSDKDLEQNLILSSELKNSILDVKGDNTPEIVVGNLDEIAKNTSLSGGSTLTIKMTVEEEKEQINGKVEHSQIRKETGEKATILFLDATLTKQIDNNEPEDSGNNNDVVLEWVIPFDLKGKKDIKVYRYHNGINVFKQLSAKPSGKLEDQTCYFDEDEGLIHIYAEKYSTYAIAYGVVENSNGGGNNSNGGSTKPVVKEKPKQILPTETGVSNWLDFENHKAYIVGSTDGLLHPEDNITRAEVAVIFYNLLKSDVAMKYETEFNPFGDVKVDDWYNKGISTLYNAGIIKGLLNGNYEPNQYITRGEFASITVQFASETYQGADMFTDISDHWAKSHINRAASYGWVNGVGDGRFLPDKNVTRAEAISLINQVLCRIPKDEKSLTLGMKTWPDNKDESKWYYLALQEASNGHTYAYTEDKTKEYWLNLIN